MCCVSILTEKVHKLALEVEESGNSRNYETLI